MQNAKKFMTIALITVAVVVTISVARIAVVSYAQKRLIDQVGEASKAITETAAQTHNAPKFVGTIANDTGAYEIWQDASGKYQYIRQETSP